MKNIIPIAACLLGLVSCNAQKNSGSGNKTQAFLGQKEGGEWVWVTKSGGKQQFEYRGGSFKPVSELKVSEKHTDHSLDIQLEGPAWESDKIGYRIYLDWRNATDIFGKMVDTLVLHRVGLDGFDSYHETSDWGVDVLKVGNSLGIGTIGFWDGQKAIRVEKTDSIKCRVDNFKGYSVVKVDYYGWQINGMRTDIYTILTIEKGSYLSRYDISLSDELPNIATGIVTLPGTDLKVIQDIKPGWNCLVTFGVQSLQNDCLGMCVFYKSNQALEITEDPDSHVVVLKPQNKKLTYYFGAAWQQDQSKVSSMEEFESILRDQVRFIK
ncbi:MAG: hypothetical protein A2X22_02830 [Bacteroidetes bacterium GWF2_49_14]|nr:MAG: hypothetical protein A2X22_02830 [Bacteroidetes bacterium GWF2_49_14]